MRLHSLTESKAGTFVGVRLTSESNARLTGWLQQNLIINPTPPDKLHVTVALDKTEKFDHHPMTYNPPVIIDPNTYKLDLFGENKNVLVLKFQSEYLVKRHMQLRKKYGFSWDWPNYSPHITLTKDIQEIKTEFEPPNFELELGREYVEEFNLDAPD